MDGRAGERRRARTHPPTRVAVAPTTDSDGSGTATNVDDVINVPVTAPQSFTTA